jgi:hypothetical protein
VDRAEQRRTPAGQRRQLGVGDRAGGELLDRVTHRLAERRGRHRVGQGGERPGVPLAEAGETVDQAVVEAGHQLQGPPRPPAGRRRPGRRAAPRASAGRPRGREPVQLDDGLGGVGQLQVGQVAQEAAEHEGGRRRLVPAVQPARQVGAGRGAVAEVDLEIAATRSAPYWTAASAASACRCPQGEPRNPPHGRLLLVLQW